MTKLAQPVFGAAFGPQFPKWRIVDGPDREREDLLPSNATTLERELARLSGYLDDIEPSVIAAIWDAWRCPVQLLPWLGWAMSVDVWDAAWPEVTQRQAIADSPEYHRRKGTRWSVEQLLALAGRPVELTEWFDRVPEGRRGTASVHIEADLDQIAAVLRIIRPLVMAAKPKSRAIFFGAGDTVSGSYAIAGAMVTEELVIVDPYAFAAEDPEGAFVTSFGLLAEELITIEAA